MLRFTKELHIQKWTGTLACPEEVINQHLSDTYSNSKREEHLAHCKELISPLEPFILFNIKEPTLAEFRDTVRGALTCSDPGPRGVPYKV